MNEMDKDVIGAVEGRGKLFVAQKQILDLYFL